MTFRSIILILTLVLPLLSTATEPPKGTGLQSCEEWLAFEFKRVDSGPAYFVMSRADSRRKEQETLYNLHDLVLLWQLAQIELNLLLEQVGNPNWVGVSLTQFPKTEHGLRQDVFELSAHEILNQKGQPGAVLPVQPENGLHPSFSIQFLNVFSAFIDSTELYRALNEAGAKYQIPLDHQWPGQPSSNSILQMDLQRLVKGGPWQIDLLRAEGDKTPLYAVDDRVQSTSRQDILYHQAALKGVQNDRAGRDEALSRLQQLLLARAPGPQVEYERRLIQQLIQEQK
ncbi:MAG: hypothetical protein AB7N80_10240 [Bdellovibrionales bacterium]